MQKILNKPSCPSPWGCCVVFCSTLYSTISRIVRNYFLPKEHSIKGHHHSIKVPIDRKYFLTENLCFLSPISILLLLLISLNLSVSLLVLTLSIDLKTYSVSWPFSQSSPSKHSTGDCWHGCSGLVIHEGGRATKHLPLQSSSSLGTDPLSASSVPFSQKSSQWLSKVISYCFCDRRLAQ